MSLPAASPACRNCGAPAGGNFCASCGQDTKPHPPTAREFLHEFIGHYVALEGALWTTLKKLAVPGALTLEYLAGRKRRYIHPLRLYLTASVVFFLVAKVLVPEVQPVAIGSRSATATAVGDGFQCARGRSDLQGPREAPERALRRHDAAPRRPTMRPSASCRSFPYAMFLLVPVFALITRAAYWNRPFNFGEHLVFALHLHAFMFFLAAIVAPFGVPMLFTIPTAIYLGRRHVARLRRAARGCSILRATSSFSSPISC